MLSSETNLNTEFSASDCFRHGLPIPEGTKIITAWFQNELTGLLEIRQIPLNK